MQRRTCVRVISEAECAVFSILSEWRLCWPISELRLKAGTKVEVNVLQRK